MTAREIIPEERFSRTGPDHPVASAPRLPRHYLPRQVLWGLLSETTSHPVTVLVAPAGAGKSLGVAGWLAEAERAADTQWVDGAQLTDPSRFEEILDAASGDGRKPPSLVVVDDSHLLPSACVRLVNERLDADPDRLRLLLLTRWDLPLSRVVPTLLGHLTVLRGDVLRLSRDEALVLASRHAGRATPDLLDAIVECADGWCAAVVLAARASVVLPPGQSLMPANRAVGASVVDLLAGEVFVGLRPQERHLLLCVASEPVLTPETARHLTHDPHAGEVLASLEATGLFVSRVNQAQLPGQEHYRIHPLLLEVARRRLVGGGVDVQRARATVCRAARLDLDQGHVAAAFRHFVSVGEYDEAACVLERHGPRLLTSGSQHDVETYLHLAEASLEGHPGAWAAIAWSRWLTGDLARGRHWADRFVAQMTAEPDSGSAVLLQAVRLHRSRTGGDGLAATVAAARSTLDRLPSGGAHDPYLSLLLLELGVAENWLGDLSAAQEHLSEAVLVSRSDDLTIFTAKALSHLALTQLMLGHEQACGDFARAALQLLEVGQPGSVSVERRTMLALALVDLETLPLAEYGEHRALPDPSDDLTSQFWRRILTARLALLEGSVADSLRVLETPFGVPRLPRHLRIAELLERAALGVITANRSTLHEVETSLGEVDAVPEQLWVRGATADVSGDLRLAASLYREAGEAAGVRRSPTGPVALVSAAQLYDHLGDRSSSEELLLGAVDATEDRRTVLPFLGWSCHGTRVGELLGRLRDGSETGWATELREALADRVDVAALFAPAIATDHELASVSEDRFSPNLSPRELEVLRELARGSTYSDAAANLFLSENTVKTHVSSLYTKLSVGRRSEALAVARKLHLI